jgi:acyl-CoA hydrolase
LLDDLDVYQWAPLISREGGVEPFARGLYGCSEMFVNGLLVLADAGIVRRKVYPDVATQSRPMPVLLDESGTTDGVSIHGGSSWARAVFTSACRK